MKKIDNWQLCFLVALQVRALIRFHWFLNWLNVTRFLLHIASAFLVFTLPTEINDTVRAFRPSENSVTAGATALITAIFIAMGQFNHAIHFYIYTLTGGVFRNELVKLFTFSNYDLLRKPKDRIGSSPRPTTSTIDTRTFVPRTILVDGH